MKRRDFLVGTAGVVGAAGFGFAQAPAPGGQPPAGGRQGGRGGGRGRGGPANVPAAKLARIGMMTLNHGQIIKLPWQDPAPQRTIELLDVPQYYIDTYGIRDVEFQHSHLAQSQDNPDPAFFKELKARFDKVGSRANQINIEIGTMAQMGQDGRAAALSGDARAAWLVRARKWADVAPLLGIKRLMLNQGALTEDSKAGVFSLWKELVDYAKPKGLIISNETRGNPGGGNRGRGAAAAPAAPMTRAERARATWGLIVEGAEFAGGYTNLDLGGAGRFADQEELHAALKGMFKTSAGSIHIKSSPTWDLGRAVAYNESLGYKGLYTIEVNPDPAIRIIYNTILSNLA